MAFRIDLTPQARDDACNAFEYIQTSSRRAADKWFSGLFRAIKSLEEMPYRCPSIPETQELKRPLRQLLFGTYRIIFEVTEVDDKVPTVKIIRIWHGFRDSIGIDDLAE